jgi:hypothetical protein
LNDGEQMRLRYGGSVSTGASPSTSRAPNEYQDSIMPTSSFAGTPEDAFDCACGLYLTGPGI